MRERNISINTIKGNLSISKYISKIQFISENINGGKKYKKYKTNKRCSKYKSRKKRMTKRKK